MTRSCSTTKSLKSVPGDPARENWRTSKRAELRVPVDDEDEALEENAEVRDDALRLRRDDRPQRRPVLVDRAELPDAVEARRMSGATRRNVRRSQWISEASKNAQIETSVWQL